MAEGRIKVDLVYEGDFTKSLTRVPLILECEDALKRFMNEWVDCRNSNHFTIWNCGGIRQYKIRKWDELVTGIYEIVVLKAVERK